MPENVGGIEALLQEDRTFPPPEEFRKQANVADPKVYEEALRDPEGFWAKFALELDWFKSGTRSSSGTRPMPNGLSVAKSTSPTTVLTAT